MGHGHLRDLPPGAIYPHLLEAIEHDVLDEIRSYATSRMKNVKRGAETPELAAFAVNKYGEGIIGTLYIVGISASAAQSELRKLVYEIDQLSTHML